ncbi:MAG: hypothetical protein RL757_1233 [Bacteroidota bacterium]|jgi:hypothetical protein
MLIWIVSMKCVENKVISDFQISTIFTNKKDFFIEKQQQNAQYTRG